MVADPSAISRQSVGNQSAISWGAIGNRSVISRWLVGDCILSVCLWLQKVCNILEIGRQPIGDQSATKNCVGIVCNRSNWSAISRQPVGDLSASCQRPPKIFLGSIWSQRRFTCSNQNLLADQLPISLQPPWNLPVTTRNLGRKEVADRLQAMCDPGLSWSDNVMTWPTKLWKISWNVNCSNGYEIGVLISVVHTPVLLIMLTNRNAQKLC